MSHNLGNMYREDFVNTITQHQELIDRCFWPNSIEAIMDNLRRESDPFAT